MDILFKTFIDHFPTNQKLSENTIAEICNHLSVLNLDKKHILIKENQRHDFAYFVVKGAVRSYYLKDGVEVVSAPKNPTGRKYKIINFNPVYEKVKIYRESDHKGSQGV